MPMWENVADSKINEGDKFLVRATLDDKIVIEESCPTLRAATRKRVKLLKERQFDVVFVVSLADPRFPEGIIVDV